MDSMPRRLPDELFRSEPQPEAVPPRSKPQPRRTPAEKPPKSTIGARYLRRGGMSLKWLVGGVLVAFLTGLATGRVISTPVEAPPDPVTSPTAQTSEAAGSAPYDGAVKPVSAARVLGICEGGTGHDIAANLLDDDPASIWRCAGSGEGAELTFSFDQGTELVGVRVVNGNVAQGDRYLAERRITSVKWTFPDGSWVVQGFSANSQGRQEIRFPATAVDGQVVMTVETATDPGESAATYDAVSISDLEFLTSA